MISVWRHLKKARSDPIMGLNEAYKRSTNPNKINLTVGAYRDNNSKPFIFESVKAASKILKKQELHHEYLPILGCNEFSSHASSLAIGYNQNMDLVAKCQTISGTGALNIAALFLSTHYKFPYERKLIYIPNPTWANHTNIFLKAGISPIEYKYYNKKNHSVDFTSILDKLNTVPQNSVFLFHVCCHNPTGMDLDTKQWKQIFYTAKQHKHFILFDFAYQGFASGNIYLDARPLRIAATYDLEFGICQSFSKNFGLYGERIGALSFVTQTVEQKDIIESQLKTIIRPTYSNPPINGSRIVNTILNNNNLTIDWFNDIQTVRTQMNRMRNILTDGLQKYYPIQDWNFLNKQTGMFSYTSLNTDIVHRLRNEYDIFIPDDGRISISGLNDNNIEYFLDSMSKIKDNKL